MSIAYELTGRTQQKARTRAALVTAARELLASGLTPTVEQAADRAAIARTTAYRYFANQRALVTAAYPVLDATSLLDADAPDDPIERVELLVARFTAQVVAHEPELRAMLRLSLESPAPGPDALPLRQGRGIGWIQQALAPLRTRLPPPAWHRLVVAIRATIGIEALVWLCDVAHLSREEAVAVMKWSAKAMVESALREAGARPAPGRPDKRRAPRTTARRFRGTR